MDSPKAVAQLAADPPDPLRLAGGGAAVAFAALLLVGLVGLIVPAAGLGLRNWLVVLFGLNSGLGTLPADPLRVFNVFDVVALVLVGVAFLGLWPVLSKISRVWTAIAIVLPLAGIGVLLATGLAGRSAVMGAGIIVGFLMLKSPGFKVLAWLGVVANALLLFADFATGTSPVPVVAGAVGIGYLLLVAWFVLLGVRQLRRTRTVA